MDLKQYATKVIKKVAENNVEVQYELELANGTKITLDEVESYGQSRIDDELQAIEGKIEKLSKEKIAEQLVKLDEEKADIQNIQTELTKVVK